MQRFHACITSPVCANDVRARPTRHMTLWGSGRGPLHPVRHRRPERRCTSGAISTISSIALAPKPRIATPRRKAPGTHASNRQIARAHEAGAAKTADGQFASPRSGWTALRSDGRRVDVRVFRWRWRRWRRRRARWRRWPALCATACAAQQQPRPAPRSERRRRRRRRGRGGRCSWLVASFSPAAGRPGIGFLRLGSKWPSPDVRPQLRRRCCIGSRRTRRRHERDARWRRGRLCQCG